MCKKANVCYSKKSRMYSAGMGKYDCVILKGLGIGTRSYMKRPIRLVIAMQSKIDVMHYKDGDSDEYRIEYQLNGDRFYNLETSAY